MSGLNEQQHRIINEIHRMEANHVQYNYFQRIPAPIKTYDFFYALFEAKASTVTLKDIPEQMLDDALLAVAIEANPLLVTQLGRNLTLDRSFYLLAARGDGRIIKDIPQELLDSEICEAAIATSPAMFRSVPKDLMTERMILSVVDDYYFQFKYIPERLYTSAVLSAVLRHSIKTMIKKIDPEYLTEHCYLASINVEARNIEYAPDGMLTEDFCIEALYENPEVFQFLPQALHSDNVIQCALKLDSNNIAYTTLPNDRLWTDAEQLEKWVTLLTPDLLSRKAKSQINKCVLRTLRDTFAVKIEPSERIMDLLEQLVTRSEHHEMPVSGVRKFYNQLQKRMCQYKKSAVSV